MHKFQIIPEITLKNVICDKDVEIKANKHLKGEYKYPFVIK